MGYTSNKLRILVASGKEFLITPREMASIADQLDEKDLGLDRLQADLAALRESNRWIPVVERLPDAYEDVLVVYAESVGEAYIVLDSDAGPQWYRNDWVLLSVTHWRSMPAPPEPQAVQERK